MLISCEWHQVLQTTGDIFSLNLHGRSRLTICSINQSTDKCSSRFRHLTTVLEFVIDAMFTVIPEPSCLSITVLTIMTLGTF